MSEFRQASRLWSGNLGLHLTQNPAKTWSFTGTVPVVLLYTTQDGQEPSEEQCKAVAQFGPRLAGVKSRVWTNPEDALQAARAIGATLCMSEKCCCYKSKPV